MQLTSNLCIRADNDRLVRSSEEDSDANGWEQDMHPLCYLGHAFVPMLGWLDDTIDTCDTIHETLSVLQDRLFVVDLAIGIDVLGIFRDWVRPDNVESAIVGDGSVSIVAEQR